MRISVTQIREYKQKGEKFSMLTAYDFTFARIFDTAGIDVLLVGDSLGNVVQGRDTTLPVTLDEIVYHTRMVRRASRFRSASASSGSPSSTTRWRSTPSGRRWIATTPAPSRGPDSPQSRRRS